MSSEQNPRRAKPLVLLLVVPAVLMIGAILYGKYRVLHPKPPPPAPPEQQALIDKWKNQNFVSLEGEVNLVDIVSEFPFDFQEPLNDEQKEQLTNSVVDFLASYQKGTLESITKWRIPLPTFKLPPSISNAMVKNYNIPAKLVTDNPAQAWNQWWKATSNEEYHGYWIGISLTNCDVRVEKNLIATNDLMATVISQGYENVGWASSGPSVLFETTAAKVLAADGHLKMATVRILTKTRNDDVICPVYYRAFWSETDKKWIPEGLVAAYARSGRQHGLFF